MFRKTLITTATLAAVMSAASAFAAGDVIENKDFGGGTINFTGSVTNAPCSIAPGDENLTVKLGQVSMKQLSADGQGSDPVDIKIHLNSCQFDAHTPSPSTPDYGQFSKVDVAFDGYTSPDAAKGLLHNDGNAANVDVQLLDAQANVIDLSKTVDGSKAQQLTGSTGVVTFKARMLAVGGAGGTGTVAATVNYKLKYF
ncbi:TPA: fimbrial protein [Salmonella enterica]|nr:fimbrial protein [Salmonella enterica]HDD2124258.1 fimbrial protein [Salmonella enterica]